jgi:hypothetical protein
VSPRRLALAAIAALALGGCEHREPTFHVRAEPLDGEGRLPAPGFRLVSDVDRGRCARIERVDVIDADTDEGLFETMWAFRLGADVLSEDAPCLGSFRYGAVPDQYRPGFRVDSPEPAGFEGPGILRKGRRYAIRVTFRWDGFDARSRGPEEPNGQASNETLVEVGLDGRVTLVEVAEEGEGS